MNPLLSKYMADARVADLLCEAERHRRAVAPMKEAEEWKTTSIARTPASGLMEVFAGWREESAALEEAYGRWTSAPEFGRDLAFAAYNAALDREEQAFHRLPGPTQADDAMTDLPQSTPSTSDVVDSLILDLLEWMGPTPRPYSEVLEAWRTSCPRLPVWEEANDRGFIARHHVPGHGALVSVSAAGADHLRKQRQSPRADGRPR